MSISEANLDPNASFGDLNLEISIGETIDKIITTFMNSQDRETVDQTINCLLSKVSD